MDLNNKSNLKQKTITTQNISNTPYPNTVHVSPIDLRVNN